MEMKIEKVQNNVGIMHRKLLEFENDKGCEWTPEVVFKVYRNDDLKELPISILNDMRKHIDSILDIKGNKPDLVDIKSVIKRSGITDCECNDCDKCSFDKHSPESREFGIGNPNICVLLNEVCRTS